MKKTILAAFAGASLLASGAASAIVVGGVDFGTLGEPPTSQHIETTTLAETFINDNGQEITGYGQVNTVNGSSNYAGGDLLYFVFEDYISQNFSAASTGFTGGLVNVYLGNVGNLLDNNSPTNIGLIEGLGDPWLTLNGHLDQNGNTLAANGTLLGGSISFTGSGLLDVVGGLPSVVSFLDQNSEPDGTGGFADIIITTSASNSVLNPNDDLTGCADGTAAVGTFCLAGSADLRGKTPGEEVPEPGVVTLLGIGLLSFGLSRGKRRKA